MGSGSTGEAALTNGRKFIGIERDQAIFQIASSRLERVSQKMRRKAFEAGSNASWRALGGARAPGKPRF